MSQGVVNHRVSIVIPTLNAEPYLEPLLQRISEQSGPLDVEVVIVDSSSDDGSRSIAARFPFVHWIEIARCDFSHGYGRNVGVARARGKYIAFLSQDALPQDDRWLSELLKPLIADPRVGGVFSRQVPREKVTPMERFFLTSCFPDAEPRVRTAAPDQRLTLPDVFYSNVSSASRRSLLLQFPFDNNIIMSEDQAFARDILRGGYSTVYQPGSVVVHSHDYSMRQLFERYFDSAYSLRCILQQTWSDTVGVGRSILRDEMRFMFKNYPRFLPRYFLYLLAKICGTALGLHADSLPLALRKKCSMHKAYWERAAKKPQLPLAEEPPPSAKFAETGGK